MSGDDLKKLSRRALELWRSNNPDRPEDVVAGSYQNHQEPDVAESTNTRHLKGSKEVLKSYHEDVLGGSYQNHREPGAGGGTSTMDLEEWEELLKSYHEAFSDSKVDILSQIAENDMVATRWRITAYHTGEFAGFAPTQKQSTWTGVSTDRFENGKIVESWVNWDKYTFLDGLGLVRINRR
jgi:predicted ester cyclase